MQLIYSEELKLYLHNFKHFNFFIKSKLATLTVLSSQNFHVMVTTMYFVGTRIFTLKHGIVAGAHNAAKNVQNITFWDVKLRN